jgi:hypothetical protein
VPLETVNLNAGTWSFPSSGQTLYFGCGPDFGGSEYVIPVVRFQILDSLGEDSAYAPIIYMKMGGTFQSGLSNQWNATANIFGTPGSGTDDSALGVIKRLGGGFYEALQKQLMNSVGSAAGAFASAGQSGKANFEYLQRKVFNQFQQLIYSGPTFRPFSFSFSMKPTSLKEARAMRDIIQTLRLASSPGQRAGAPESTEESSTDALDNAIENTAVNDSYSAGGTSSTATYSGIEFDQLIGTQNKLFDYPDMCKFQVMLHNNYTNQLTTLFESGRCVIESIAVDYGSGNKMTFFDSDINEHFPTDVTLSIGLKETQLQTAPTLAVDSENTMI